MKKYTPIILFATVLLGGQSVAQTVSGGQVPLTNLKTTNNPCFQLLDIAPASISEPASPKDLGLSLLQNLAGGSALPKNFALSVAPYWYFKPTGEDVYKYLNVSHDYNGKTKQNVSGVLRKLNISVSSTFNDSTNGSLLKNTNYYAGGVYTNLLTLRSGPNKTDITTSLDTISGRERAGERAFWDSLRHTIPEAIVGPQLQAMLLEQRRNPNNIKAAPASIANFMRNDPANITASKNLQTALNAPLFQLDAAGAYSQAFPGNSTSGSRFNRIAGWLTATLNLPLSTKHGDYLSLLLLGKLMSDNLLTDSAKSVYTRASAHDIGGKLTYTMSSAFSLGFEGIWRTYPDEGKYNSHRAVGFIQYKVNDNIYLTGSFGQNFGSSNNLFTLLGVNFGFGSKSASLPD